MICVKLLDRLRFCGKDSAAWLSSPLRLIIRLFYASVSPPACLPARLSIHHSSYVFILRPAVRLVRMRPLNDTHLRQLTEAGHPSAACSIFRECLLSAPPLCPLRLRLLLLPQHLLSSHTSHAAPHPPVPPESTSS